MKLKDYLKENQFTQKTFLLHIKENKDIEISPSTFAKWVRNIRIPRKDEAKTIYEITNGAVEPNDFYDL